MLNMEFLNTGSKLYVTEQFLDYTVVEDHSVMEQAMR
jgi:hypothetical protein